MMTRKSSYYLSIFLAWVLMSYIAGCERAPKVKKVEDLVPKDALAVLVVEDVDQAVEKFEQTSIAKLMENPEVKSFADVQLSTRPSLFNTYGIESQAAKEIFQKTAIIAVPEVPENPNDPPGAVFIADIKDREKALRSLIKDKVTPELKKKYPGIQFSEEEFSGISLQHITFPTGKHLYYGFLDKAFVFSASMDAIQRTVEMYLSKGEEISIEKNEGYQSTIKEVRKGSEGYGYVNFLEITPEMWNVLQNVSFPLWEKGGQGANNAAPQAIQSLGWSFSYKNGGILDKVYIRTDPELFEDAPEIFPGSGSSPKLRTIGMVPEEMLLYSGIVVNDPLGLWHFIQETMQQTMTPDEYAEMQQLLLLIEQQLGVEVDEIFENLGGEAAFAAGIKNLSIESLLLGFGGKGELSFDNFPMLLCLQVKDQEKHLNFVQRLLGLTGSRTTQEEYQGETIYSAPIPNPLMPTRLYYSFLDNTWIATLNKETLTTAIHVTTQGTGSLEKSAKFRELQQHVSDEVFSITYVDVPGLLRVVHGALQGMGGILAQGLLMAEGTDISKLPDLKTLADSLSGSVTVTRARKDGFISETYSPVGNVFVEGGILTGIMSSFVP